jgi:opacity protein-like surface antigen
MIVLVAGVAAAQDFPKMEVFGGYDLLKLGGSDINDLANSFGENAGVTPSTSKLLKKGFDISIAYNMNNYFGIEANFLYNKGVLAKASGTSEVGDYDAKLNVTDFAFMAGPRLTYRKIEKVTPFAHALFGVDHAKSDPSLFINGTDYSSEVSSVFKNSDSGFGMAIGGGIDLSVNKMIGIRLIQADYFMGRHQDFTLNNVNLAFGVVLHLGGK